MGRMKERYDPRDVTGDVLLERCLLLEKVLGDLLDAYLDQFGEDACDCRPEPENAGHVCPQCRARVLLSRDGAPT